MKLYTHFSANNIVLKSMPFNAELAMEAYLIENPNVLQINEDDQIQIISYELPLKNGRKKLGTDGRIDLLAFYNNETLAIIELKNNILRKEHYEQLNEYFVEKDEILKKNIDQIQNTKDWLGVLVGTDIDSNLLKEIEDNKLLLQGTIPLIAIIIKRYLGENSQVYITTETFSSNKTKRDYSKYEFNGGQYNKGKLVIALLKEYVKTNSNISLEELQQIFSQKISGGMEIIIDLDEAIKKSITPNKKGKIYRQYFIKPDEIIILSDGRKTAVLDWWDKTNLPHILGIFENLNYKITRI
jgi:hypothetical protein